MDGGTLEITGGSIVFGNIEATNGTTVTITDSTANGNVLTQDGTVTITHHTVSGNLEINDPSSCTEFNNIVNGANTGCR